MPETASESTTISPMTSIAARVISVVGPCLGMAGSESFEASTLESRSHHRHRRLFLTILSSGGAKVTSLAAMVISVPLVVRNFGQERYALWATITSTITLLVFADFGLGNGLLNVIAESDGSDDSAAAVSYISTGFYVLLSIALLGAIVLRFAYPVISWKQVFNLHSATAIREAGPAVAVFIGCFLAQLPLGVVQRVQFGYQEGFLAQIWSAAGNLLGLAGLCWVVHSRLGLPLLILAIAGAPVLTGVLNSLVFFTVQRPWLLPRISQVSSKAAARLLGLGFYFFVLQIAGAVGYQTDNIILAQVMGTASVAIYAVAAKLFVMIPSFINLVMMPLWPAYGEAFARGDAAWMKNTLRRSLLLSVGVTVLVGTALVIFGRPLIRGWVGTGVEPPLGLLVALAIWAVVASGVSVPVAMFCNGIGFVRVQAICSVLMALSNVALSIGLTRMIGICGVVYGSVIAQAVFVLLPYFIYIPKLVAKMSRSAIMLDPEFVVMK